MPYYQWFIYRCAVETFPVHPNIKDTRNRIKEFGDIAVVISICIPAIIFQIRYVKLLYLLSNDR